MELAEGLDVTCPGNTRADTEGMSHMDPKVAKADEVVPETRYCFHCAVHHNSSEMDYTRARDGRKIWRCKKSLKAAKLPQHKRDAFGKTISAANKAESRTMLLNRLNTERSKNPS